ncbi:hypothetical protein FACS1894172_20010 [Spirochaetia bacterium]|nr:hypothetical protein FACS1894172_20010 [Spirochaetia bacterium]
MVGYNLEDAPDPSQEEMDRVAAMTDDEIDYSDIPKQTDLSEFVPWEDRHLLKNHQKIQIILDKDILEWLEKTTGDYQQQINAILREVMKLSKITA